MKICILSDSHDNSLFLDTAVAEAKAMGAESILHCGDVVAPSTLGCLIKHGIPVHLIHGNNTGDLYALGRMVDRSNGLLNYYGMDADLKIDDKRIFLVHYPHYARALATTGDWDLVCCGHNHKASQELLINLCGTTTVLLNPGTVGGIGNAPATYIFGDLTQMSFVLKQVSR